MPIRIARIGIVLLFFKLWPPQIIFTPYLQGVVKGKKHIMGVATFEKTCVIIVGINCTADIEQLFD